MADRSKDTNSDFDKMILAKIRELKETYDADNEERIRQAVGLEMRNRGNYFGTFNNLKSRRLEYVGSLGKGLVTYPVVPRALRSKSATMIATKVLIDLKPARQLPEIEAGVDIATSIVKRAETNITDEDFEINTAHLRQTQRLCYYEIFNNGRKGIRYQEQERGDSPAEIAVHGDIYNCPSCGAEVPAENLPEDRRCSDEECNDRPELRLMTRSKTRKILPFKTVTKRTGEPDLRLISALLTRIDDLPCVGLKFDNAGWFNVNELKHRLEIEEQFPQFKQKLGTPDYQKWSPGTVWWYALTKEEGNFHYAGGLAAGYKKGMRQYHELERWYFAPKNCGGYKAPRDWKLEGEDKDAEPGFSMKQNETIEEAVRRHFGTTKDLAPQDESGEPVDEAIQPGSEDPASVSAAPEEEWPEYLEEEEFTGLCVWVANGQLLKVENWDFTENHGVIGWINNPSSYFPLGEERLLNLQDAITNVLSMLYSAGLKRQLAALFANPNLVDEDTLRRNHTGGFIFAKTESGLPLEQVNWQNQIFYLDPPALDALVWELAQLIIQIQKEESGVYDETVGVANDKNQTMGGRIQAANQSLTLMLSPAQSKRKGKIELIKKLLKQWQKMPDAAFQMVKGTFNEEWKPQDIASFKKLDIDSDVIYKVVEGTDIPQAVTDAQGALLMVNQLGLLDPSNPLPIGFLTKLLRALGVDYDIKNADASRRLAQKRLKLLKLKILKYPEENAFVVVPEPGPDGQVIERETLNPQILMEIMSDPRMQAHESENHQVMMEFFTDQINGELGREIPNRVLLFMLDVLYKQHLDTLNNMMAREAATQGQIQGTAAAVGQETTRALSGADEAEAKALDTEKATRDEELAAEEDRRIDEMEEKQRDREHDIAKTVIASTVKTQGKGGPKN